MKTSYNATKKALLLAYQIHGAGIDCDYELLQNNTSVLLCNYFHCMNEDGYYDGWLNFIVRINKKTQNISIQYLQPNHNTYRKYGQDLKEYLYDVYCRDTNEILINYKRPYYLKKLHF